MDFIPCISSNLKPMPSDIFQPEWGKLRQIIEAKEKGGEKEKRMKAGKFSEATIQ